NLSGSLAAKRLELLHVLVPSVSVVAYLANPTNAPYTEIELTELRNAAKSLGLQLHILNASTIGEIDAAFEALVQVKAGAILISAETFFFFRREQIIALAARNAVPTIYSQSEWTKAGGLISYGFNISDDYRQMGIYVGRILKGERPAVLPVQQSTKIELAI